MYTAVALNPVWGGSLLVCVVSQDMLAMRKSVGNLTGQLLVNGQPASASFIRQSSYVPQVRVWWL